MSKLIKVCMVLLISSSVAFTAAYKISEHGTKAMGMGSAFVAQASDASAVFFNPAGLTYLKGWNVLAGATLIAPKSDFTGPTPSTQETDMESQIFYPPHAYVSYTMENNLSFGVGFFAPFGLGTEWPENWVGRYLAVKADLHVFFINPTIAYQFSPEFSVGAGFSYIFGDVSLTRKLNLEPPLGPLPADWDSELEGTGNNFSFNIGVLYKPSEEFSIGATYRHLAEVEFEGDATFENVPNVPLPSPPYPPGMSLPLLFPDQTGKTKLPMPGEFRLGVAYTINQNFIVEADFEYVFWSAYEDLTLEFDEGVAGETELSEEKDYEDAYLIRLGGEYKIDKLALRAGFVYDMSPVPDKSLEPLLPDSDRFEGIIGLGYKFNERIWVDAAYQFIKATERTVTAPTNMFPGTYNSTANLFGLSIGLAIE